MQHPVVANLYNQLALPVIAAPMFLVSGPEMVIAQSASGIIGSMPSLNARPQSQLSEWLSEISESLATLRAREPERVVAPWAINLIVHHSNNRVEADLATCEAHKVPIIITSLRAPGDVVSAVHAWGGKVFHDVTTLRHAEKALEAGVDGLILVSAGAGGHAGTISPFALVGEVRRMFDGPIILSGAISRGHDIAAARAMGADFAYMGTRFIASHEARAADAYKQMIVDSAARDIVYTPYFSGIPGNYLRQSVIAAGFDPDALPAQPAGATRFDSDDKRDKADASAPKPWRDIWSAGQGVGNIEQVMSVADIVEQLQNEYADACHRLRDGFGTQEGVDARGGLDTVRL